jgi:branched-chain amino acid transport system ATP-binding protein
MTEDGVLLRPRGICKRFGGVLAVDQFSGVVWENHLVGIIGPNGAGKTTILNLLSGVYAIDSGEVIFQGKAIGGLQSFEIGRLGIARTFQNIRLFKDMSVLDNVRSAYSWRAKYGLLKAMVGWRGVGSFERQVIDQSVGWLDKVGLGDYRHEPAGSLPYGLQRRVELARALAGEPRLLLLDEPAAGLNPAEVQGLIVLIRRLFTELKLSIILIEHRMEVVMDLCQWIYVQNFGCTIAEGTPDQIQRNPVVISAYLGEDHVCSR